MDKRTQERLNKLYPDIRNRYLRVWAQMKEIHGKKLRISQGIRTHDEQNEMYARGRTSPGTVITNARAGLSFHQYGLAIDSFFSGKHPYLADDPKGHFYWAEYGRIAKEHGFVWGGHFSGLKDRPHIQFSYGLSIAEVLQINTGLELKPLWLKLDAIREAQ